MTSARIRRSVAGVVAAATLLLSGAGLGAQQGLAPAQEDTIGPILYPRPVIRVGQDLVVPAGREVRHVRMALGRFVLDGHVSRDVVVWVGDVELGPTARIDGALIVVAGSVTIAEGAVVGDDFVVIAGTVDGPADFTPGRDHVIIGAPGIGHGVRSAVPWVTRGLLLGRPIVPDLGWVWTFVFISFGVAVALALIFGQAVRASSDVVVTRPLRAFMTGIIVLIATGPLLVILAATVVGIVVIPVVIFGLLVAWTIGKVGVARGIGHRIVHESHPDSRFQGLRSLVIGFAAIVLAYMVPVLGLVTWSLVSVFGLGAATIAVMASLGRKYPPRPRRKKRWGRRDGGGDDDARGAAPAAPERDDLPLAGPAGHSASADPAMFTAEPPRFEAPPDPPPPIDAPPPIDPPPPVDPPYRQAPPPRDRAADAVLLLPRAPFLERAGAFAIDCMLVAVISGLLQLRPDGMYFILLITYHVAFWTWQGTTIGGIIISLRVIRTDGGRLRFVDGVVRGLSGVFSVLALGIGCFWMIYDEDQQTWHDRIAGTYVVKVPRHWPLEGA